MPSLFRNRHGNFSVQWSAQGRRRTRSFPVKREAELFKLKLEVGEIDSAASASPTFGEYAERWLVEYCQVRKAETLWEDDWTAIRIHLLPLFGGKRLNDLAKSDLLELQRNLLTKTSQGKQKKLSPRTVNKIVVLAKRMMSVAVEWNVIAANPWINVRPIRVQDAEMDFWTPEERDTFIRNAVLVDEPFARLVAVACHTGLRLGELAGLRRRDIDFTNRLIHVRAQYSVKLGKRLEHTKGKTAGRVPMNAVVIAALGHVHGIGENESVFDVALFRDARHYLAKVCKRIGVKGIRFHDLRHTFASCLAMAGVDLMVIQKLMRHKSYQMTLRYAHLHPDTIRGATDVLAVQSKCSPKSCPQPTEIQQTLEGSWWAHLDLNQGPAIYEDVDSLIAS